MNQICEKQCEVEAEQNFNVLTLSWLRVENIKQLLLCEQQTELNSLHSTDYTIQATIQYRVGLLLSIYFILTAIPRIMHSL